MSAVAALIAATLNAGTPLLIAGIGILIHEKSGVLNLGIEGIMLMGAVAGFGVTFATGSFMLGSYTETRPRPPRRSTRDRRRYGRKRRLHR